jgi:hypothetical protein
MLTWCHLDSIVALVASLEFDLTQLFDNGVHLRLRREDAGCSGG